MSYQLNIDSAAFTSIYHRTSTKLKSDFKIRSLDEYSSVKSTFTSAADKVANTMEKATKS